MKIVVLNKIQLKMNKTEPEKDNDLLLEEDQMEDEEVAPVIFDKSSIYAIP